MAEKMATITKDTFKLAKCPGITGGKQETEPSEFRPPPEAPVFHPTLEEFADPLAYISKIRPIAENTGICKIKPPSHWQPPFAVDVDKLRFTPRIQKLNELEAKTRIKLNFLDQIAKFWELQGSALKIPMLEKRALDLYTLHRLVQAECGFECVNKEQRWAKIALKMGYRDGKIVGAILKGHYERLIYPFDVFKQDKSVNIKLNKAKKEEEETVAEDNKDYKPHGIIGRMAVKPPPGKRGRRYKRSEDDDTKNEKDVDDEKCLGERSKTVNCFDRKEKKNKKKTPDFEFDPLSKYVCHNCNRGDSEEHMLLCDGCDDSYHTFCLIPPLLEVPEGDWRCPKCVAEEVSKPMEAFGFEQAQREYTLQQFGEMADHFKSEYFNMPAHLVPTSTVEKEFWRIVSSIDEDVTVEYGADLHTMDHGSGFPTRTSLNLLPGDQEYADSGWNLNNLPVLDGSVLGYINADISGMKVPWMYVGMCFATFCWHNEDHWSYSINYLHWGEPKTWYGVSGSKAELFEETMKSAAPELFQSQPDLLHQLVTIMNPNILMDAGVPVYRTDQQAGEFVVTFPRAYHAGFNQGYNFAEAVNFAPADWLRMGRQCILHYSHLRRFCVFSHDELVCKMGSEPDKLDITVAAATYQDMLQMVEVEKKLRKALLDWGVNSAKREVFEQIPDDERQCEVCKTTCFLSALTCKCTPNILVCLRHYSNLCDCAPANHSLHYRFTLDELYTMLKGLKLKAESFDHWAGKVKAILDVTGSKITTLAELKELLGEAEKKKFPKSDLLDTLTSAVESAEKFVSVIQKLDLKVSDGKKSETKYKLTSQELELFCEELDGLACVLEESKHIKELLEKVKEFERESTRLLSLKLNECSSSDLEALVSLAGSLCVQLPNFNAVAVRLKQVNWLRDVQFYIKRSEVLALDSIKRLITMGSNLPANTEVEEELNNLKTLLSQSQDWETRAKAVLTRSDSDVLIEVDKLLAESSKIKAYLPTEEILYAAMNQSRSWLKQLEQINSAEFYPYYDAMEKLIREGHALPLRLVEVKRMEACIESANEWKVQTGQAFLLDNSVCTLMEVLCPRKDDGLCEPFETLNAIGMDNSLELSAVAALFKQAQAYELKFMKQLRRLNSLKSMNPNSGSLFCVCKKGASGLMMRCELCHDWYHSSCVPLPKAVTSKYKANFTRVAIRLNFRDCKFLCTNCCRTKRPRLDTILNLLTSLQKLYVRIPEGEILQCLTERAISWQDRASHLLQQPELIDAKSKLSLLHQKCSEMLPKQGSLNEMNTVEDNSGGSLDLCLSEHAYSVHPKDDDDGKYFVPLGEEVREKIEEALLEGDLLEVCLDETFQLWKLLQASRHPETEPVLINLEPLKSCIVKRGRKPNPENLLAKKCKLNNKKEKMLKSKPVKEVVVKKKRGRKRKEEVDEMCAASVCVKPSAENLDWVQCDGGCEEWFHVACVGLSVHDVKDVDYICPTCTQDISYGSSTASESVSTVSMHLNTMAFGTV